MTNKLKAYKERLLKEPKLFLIAALVLIIVIILMEPNFFKKISFKIEDKCGKFVNLMSHTIEDENACKIRCGAQCESAEHKYKKVEFNKSDIGCNSCVCYCK